MLELNLKQYDFMNIKNKKYKAIDFFCGGGGMTCGLRQAGIDVIAGVDFDKDAKETYEFNNSGTKFILADINILPENYFEKEFHLKKNDDNLIMVGCSPCQYYSIINTTKEKSVKSKDLLLQFKRFIDYYNPGYVLVENVPGIVTNKNSILSIFLQFLKDKKYKVVKDIVNMKNYGIPQNRRRFSLIATRLEGKKISLPQKDSKIINIKDILGVSNGFPHVQMGHRDYTVFNHTVAGLSDKTLQRIRKTTHDGGSRLDWANDANLQLNCFIGKDKSFKDTYGRMWWNRPSPTITTKFFSVSNGRFVHPEEDRPISLREGATIQTFPKDYVFKTTSIATTAKLIGNAVPCEYARRLGEIIINN
jgi:DNA (cytosine-5)-methyltransferase 1